MLGEVARGRDGHAGERLVQRAAHLLAVDDDLVELGGLGRFLRGSGAGGDLDLLQTLGHLGDGFRSEQREGACGGEP